MEILNYQAIIYALLGGILPALLWLFFWLREDYKNPEPKRLIVSTFLLGMCAVILVIPFQRFIDNIFVEMTVYTIVIWVVAEEVLKLAAAYFGGIKTAEDNEPVDPIIYTITAALGFVALENALFIFGPLTQSDLVASIITGNMRFIGASILHVISSGTIGVALALSFYRPKWEKGLYLLLAIALSVVLHSLFNLAILYWGASGTILAFIGTWIGAAFLLLAFEMAKSIKRT